MLTTLQSHTGTVLALAFQSMLTRFGLVDKILAMNADNASSNDTQTTALAGMENSFESDNRVRCFGHTIQLSAHALVEQFNAGMKAAASDKDIIITDEDVSTLEEFDEEADEEADEDDGDIDWNADDFDDGIEELDALLTAEHERIVADTASIRETVSKVSSCPLF
jgi:hypothetical protein